MGRTSLLERIFMCWAPFSVRAPGRGAGSRLRHVAEAVKRQVLHRWDRRRPVKLQRRRPSLALLKLPMFIAELSNLTADGVVSYLC